MRFKHDYTLVEQPRSLLLSKKDTQEIFSDPLEKTNQTVICDTLNHGFEGWPNILETSENCLNINNNNNTKNTIDCKDNLNIKNNNNNSNTTESSDDVILDSKPDVGSKFFVEEEEEEKADANKSDSESSSEEDDDEDDSSLSFSDTSPLLDVSSLDSSSSSSTSSNSSCCSGTSNVSDDTDMSDDEAFDDDNEEDEDHDMGNNNTTHESEDKYESMDTSWMSMSADSPARKFSLNTNKKLQPAKTNGVILPDLLPVGITKHEDDSNGDDLELQLRRRDLRLDAAPKLSGECCIVEITTQPDIQVDIRLNSTSNKVSNSYTKHRNSYPRDAKNYNFYFKSGASESQTVQKTRESQNSFTLGEGVRLNNFTLVNEFSALNLMEFMNTNKAKDCVNTHDQKTPSFISYDTPTQTRCSQTENDKDNERIKDRYTFHSSSLNSRNNRKRHSQLLALEEKSPNFLNASKSDIAASFDFSAQDEEKVQNELNSSVVDGGSYCSLQSQRQMTGPVNKSVDRKQNLGNKELPQPSMKTTFNKFSSSGPCTMDAAAIPRINWAAVARANKESEWIKKRQKDREEIRRKLAMDSDNEDYVSEKLIKNQDSSSIQRLKGNSNLQICFMNENAKDTEGGDPDQGRDQGEQKFQNALPKVFKRNLLFPPPPLLSNFQTSKIPNNNNNAPQQQQPLQQPQVIRRQRPSFFFSRPRSWHAAKAEEEKPDLDEDLFTRHRRLQTEAREALAQAKDMARMQMEIERQKKKKSPIADIVGIAFPNSMNFLNQQALLDMNLAQLQVIVNDLHSQIETLNDDLVKFLLERDDLHMEQDSMLVDIEDLTRYLGLKENSSISHPSDGLKASAKSPGNTLSNKLFKSDFLQWSKNLHLKKSKNMM